MTRRKLSELTPHPINVEIYGNLSHMDDTEKIEFEELMNSIKTRGQLDAIVIDQNDTILSGHRRFYAMQALDMEEAKTESFTFKNEFQRIDYLLEKNLYRSKTKVQKIREGKFREANIAEKAKQRMLHTDTDENPGETIKLVTREAVGNSIGMSGSSFAAGKKVVEEIDHLREEGKIDEADALETKANVSISGAANDIKAKVKKPAEKPDPNFWFIDDLEAMIKTMESRASKMAARSKSTTPAAVSWFFHTIQKDAKLYRSWFKENLHDCPVCKGTMFLPSGDDCRNCISGKVGVYEIPDADPEPDNDLPEV